MKSKMNVKPDAYTYKIIIRNYLKHGLIDQAIEAYNESIVKEIELDSLDTICFNVKSNDLGKNSKGLLFFDPEIVNQFLECHQLSFANLQSNILESSSNQTLINSLKECKKIARRRPK